MELHGRARGGRHRRIRGWPRDGVEIRGELRYGLAEVQALDGLGEQRRERELVHGAALERGLEIGELLARDLHHTQCTEYSERRVHEYSGECVHCVSPGRVTIIASRALPSRIAARNLIVGVAIGVGGYGLDLRWLSEAFSTSEPS